MAGEPDKLKRNPDRLSDVMAKTTNMFNTDMAGTGEAVKKERGPLRPRGEK
jgi:hypothetical protein